MQRIILILLSLGLGAGCYQEKKVNAAIDFEAGDVVLNFKGRSILRGTAYSNGSQFHFQDPDGSELIVSLDENRELKSIVFVKILPGDKNKGIRVNEVGDVTVEDIQK